MQRHRVVDLRPDARGARGARAGASRSRARTTYWWKTCASPAALGHHQRRARRRPRARARGAPPSYHAAISRRRAFQRVEVAELDARAPPPAPRRAASKADASCTYGADLALMPVPAHARGERVVGGEHHAAVAEPAQVLGRVEREAAGAPEGARGHAVVARADRLRRVLDHPEAMALGERAERRACGASRPKRWTGTMPTTRPSARSIGRGHRRRDRGSACTGSMSANSGRAPTRTMVLAVAKKLKGVVMTALPGPTPSAPSASASASVPDADPDRVRHAAVRGHRRLEALDVRARG